MDDNKTDDNMPNDMNSDEGTAMTPEENTPESEETPKDESSMSEEEAPVTEMPEEANEPMDSAPTASEQPSSGTPNATPGGMDDRGRQLYNVKCSNCGNDTTVPFVPAEGRPVYCRDCFMKMKDNS